MGHAPEDVVAARQGGLLHDLGRVGADGDRIASRHVCVAGAELARQLLAEPAAAPAGA